MSDLEVCRGQLDTLVARATAQRYARHPMPSSFDDEVSAVARAWGDGSPAERETWEEAVQPGHADLLHTFARRMAVVAVRQRSERHVLLGIVALALEGFRSQPRATVGLLALLHHSATLIGVAPEGPVEAVARVARPDVERALRSFLDRPPERRSIEALGYEQADGPEGFTYRQRW